MGLKKVKKVEEKKSPNKTETKKVIKKEVAKVEEVKQEIVEPVKTENPKPNLMSEKYSIGLTGNDPLLNTFRGKIKMQGKTVQKVLSELIIEWNSKNN